MHTVWYNNLSIDSYYVCLYVFIYSHNNVLVMIWTWINIHMLTKSPERFIS